MVRGASRTRRGNEDPWTKGLLDQLKSRWEISKAGLKPAKTLNEVARDLMMKTHQVTRVWQQVKGLDQWDDAVVVNVNWKLGRPKNNLVLTHE
jgi:hypothetical protein